MVYRIQEESWEENLNGKVWTGRRIANHGKKATPMMLLFSEPRNKSWKFWDWFAQISDLRKSLGSHFSWISLSLTLYPYIEIAGLVIFYKEMEKRFFRPNQIFCFCFSQIIFRCKKKQTTQKNCALQRSWNSSLHRREGTNFE